MKKINSLLLQYGDSHQNSSNKLIHWFCVPSIMFSLVGLLMCIPYPSFGMWTNWASILLACSMIYYLRLSLSLSIGLLVWILFLIIGNYNLRMFCIEIGIPFWLVCILIFIVAWIGQFIGHRIEGKKPSFLEDIQFLLIGPAWLLSFIYKKLGIKV